MIELQIESVSEPLAQDADTTLLALHLVAQSQFVGVLPSLPTPRPLDADLIRSVLEALSKCGVARDAALLAVTACNGTDYRRLLAAASADLEHSPLPASTWPVLSDTLGEELLARLLGVSVTSLRRYARGQRLTPGDVAARLHALALLVAELSGAYNEFGIRRWFTRSRTQLDHRAPAELLDGGFDPDGPQFVQLRALVDSMSAAGAA